MARRSLDMLPLLDVFMVVLFVFATIQESELDSSLSELDALQAELLETQASAAAESARAAVLAAELELAGQRERREAELDAELAEYRRACGPRRPGDPLCPAAESEARELAEVAAVHEQLLSHVAVFEIEIGGEKQPDEVVNHCCYRSDPPRGEWRSCGEIPTREAARADWFDDGGAGLREALRQTRDGYAIVLLRQDEAATYQISKDLTRLLHARLREHYVYDNGLARGPLACPLSPGTPGSSSTATPD